MRSSWVLILSLLPSPLGSGPPPSYSPPPPQSSQSCPPWRQLLKLSVPSQVFLLSPADFLKSELYFSCRGIVFFLAYTRKLEFYKRSLSSSHLSSPPSSLMFRNIVITRMEVTIFCADLEPSNQASSELIILLPISLLHGMRIDYQSLIINNS